VKPRKGWAEAAALGVLFPASILAGYLLGRWLGAWFGLGEWPALLGAGLGVAGGFLNLFQWASRSRP
jgi:hypothetical protein